MKGEQEQLQSLGPQATIARPAFRILIYRMRTRYDLRQATTRAKMQEENLKQYLNLKVEQAVWLKSKKAKEGQRHSSAILAVQSKGQAREIVTKGLVLEGILLTAEVCYLQQRVVQCFICIQFGYTSIYYKEVETETVCRTCSSQHKTNVYNSAICKCSNCKGSHASQLKVCKVKQAAIAKAREFYTSFQQR